MPASFDRLGLWFKLFSSLFYPRYAIQGLSHFIKGFEDNRHVVDLGCGSGTLIEFAHSVRSDMRYICVDPSKGMMQYAPTYAWRVMALGEELPVKDNVVCAMMIGDAIRHFKKPQRGISEVMRTLMPGGKLFIFDIHRQTLMGWLISHMEGSMHEPAHILYPG